MENLQEVGTGQYYRLKQNLRGKSCRNSPFARYLHFWMWMSTCCVVFRLANHHPVQLYDKLKKEYETQLKPRETINYCEIFVQGARSGPLYWTHRFRIQSGRGRLPLLFLSFFQLLQEEPAFKLWRLPKAKKQVFPADLQSFQHFHRAKIGACPRLSFFGGSQKRRMLPAKGMVHKFEVHKG